jgi:hypothetical protein
MAVQVAVVELMLQAAVQLLLAVKEIRAVQVAHREIH